MGQTENPIAWGMFAKYRVLTFFFYRLAIGQTQAQVFLPGPSHGSEQLAQTENQPSLKGNTGHQITSQQHTTN
jgi:hypothetical protein